MKGWLFKVFLFWITVRDKYERIKEDPEESKVNVSLGVRSLVLSLVGIALTIGFVLLAISCFGGMSGGMDGVSGAAGVAAGALGAIFILIGAFVCGILALVCFVTMVLASIVYAIYQLKLNKRPIGIIALIVSLLISLGGVAAVLLILSLVPANVLQ